jgi:hypothetical protein
VTEQTGGVRIKGGRRSGHLQFGNVIVNDPTGGSGMFRLPVDAVDDDVLLNSYGAEYGGFSSGLIVVRPRTPPTDGWSAEWMALVHHGAHNPFDPIALRSSRPAWCLAG